MARFGRLFVLSALLLSIPPALCAEEPPPTRLDDLLPAFLENNPEIRAAQYRFEAATKRPPQAGALPDPVLLLSDFGVGRPFSSLNVSDFAYRGIGISQEIPFPGKRGLAAEEAQREADSERDSYRAVVLEKTAQLKSAYYDWFYVTKAVEITSKNRDLLGRLEQIARARYAVGRGILADVLKAQVEVSRLVQQLERLEQRKSVIEARMRLLLNSETVLTRAAVIRQSPFSLQLSAVLEIAESQSPRLQAARARIESRAVGIDRARREYRPDFNVSFQWLKTGSQFPDYYMAAAEVRLPVHFSRKQRLGLEEAEARFQESRYLYEAERQELVFEVRDKYFAVLTSERLLALYESGIIPQSSTALESALAGYEVGNIDFLTLLDNAATLRNYEMQYYEELANHERALAELEALVGMELGGSQP